MNPLMRTCLLAMLPLLAIGCAPTRQQIRHAELTVGASVSQHVNCQRKDHCAMTSSLHDLGHAADGSATGMDHAVILDLGEDALIARLNLIRSARRSIDIQTYIWADDDAGRLVLDELVRAARRGVKVRILADQLFAFKSVPQLARLARTHVNLQLRLYNPVLHEAETNTLGIIFSGMLRFSRTNQRMHNKLLLVDDAVGITGGRNYDDRYFDWGSNFDFLDRDVLVAGPVATEMAASFEVFWTHHRSVPLTQLRDVIQRLIAEGPGAPGWQPPHYENTPRVERALAAALTRSYIHSHFIARTFSLANVAYFSDRPEKTEVSSVHEREMTAHLMNMVASTQHELVLQTPYLVISKPAQKIFRHLHTTRPNVQILISTNSLASTDAFAVYALSHKYKRRYLAVFGFNIYEQKPHPADAPRMIAHFAELSGFGGQQGSTDRYSRVPLTSSGVRVSLHAKSMVVDHTWVMIGSHNFDPRSDDYNTEAGIIVKDRHFAAAVRASILATTRPGNSWVIAKRQVDDVFGRINRALAKLSARLPIFDLWPIRYATSYELKAECPPMLRSDPRFFQCHEPVGEFPEVALPLKTIYTSMITAFGAGISGIM